MIERVAAEEAAAKTQKSIAVLPFVNMSDDASNVFFSDGLSEELLNLLAKIPELRVKGTALASYELGQFTEYEQAFAELRERWGDRWPIEIAHVYAWVGDTDEVFTWLEKEFEVNGLGGVMVDNFFTNQRDDPRWQPLLEKAGVSADQLAAIDFNVTLPN